ncbi:DUF1801 domain-containing protein [Actinomadura logoneensis]|uniref:DUF1801 domain-containing protein n=1 Tax=Actinomadura logoneensis TaxID=2293572 RepID=A0A372JRH7_9ACTN|nr:DUF1801 domain-containing protein [Actinomadura logoneensis]RFU42560.1 DUF1801 domain-containing protein [Actinomadura logoneensis]
MAEKKTAAKKNDAAAETFSAEERAAMKERAKELKASARRASLAEKAAQAEADVLAKIEEFPEPDRTMAERIHAIVKESAPSLEPKLWYGMPSYALDGKVVCFFQNADKFKARYATLGFNDTARLDDGDMWPTAYALDQMTPEVEARIAELVKRAAG